MNVEISFGECIWTFGHYVRLMALALCVYSVERVDAIGWDFFQPVEPARAIQVIAHRGHAQMAPVNSLKAVLACHEDFVEWAEVDVRLTGDGHHVIIDDDVLSSRTNGQGNVSNISLEELQKLDCGSWFSMRFAGSRLISLPELLEACRGKVNLYLDCQSIDPDRLVQEILDAGMQNQVVIHDDIATLKLIHGISGGALPLMGTFRSMLMDLTSLVSEVDLAAVEIDAAEVTRDLCLSFKRQGIKVQANVSGPEWDTVEVWDKMIAAEVDWIQTSHPVHFRFHEAKKRLGSFPIKIAFHRGASRYAPENSLSAIKLGMDSGADYIEVDVRTTLDHQHVLLHDRSLQRTTNGSGFLREIEYTSLQMLDAGSWFSTYYSNEKVPTLHQALCLMQDGSGVYLDAKDIRPEELIRYIDTFSMHDTHVVYQSLDYCRELRKLTDWVRIMPPLSSLDHLPEVASHHPYAVDVSWNALSRKLVEACHDKNILVFSDALGEHESVTDYLHAIELGIDLIQTDHPMGVLRAIEVWMSR